MRETLTIIVKGSDQVEWKKITALGAVSGTNTSWLPLTKSFSDIIKIKVYTKISH